MKLDYQKLNNVTGEITLVVEEADYAEKVKKQLKEIGKRHPEPGFRAGKVPAALLEKKYGKSVKYDEINKLVGDAVYDYIKKNDINVLGNPIPDKANAIDDDAKEFTLKFKVGVAPDFEVKVDKDVHIPYYKIEVTDEMIDRQDEAMRRRYGTQEPGDEVDDTALVKGVITELNEDGTVKEDGIMVENGIVAPQYFKSEDQKKIFIGRKPGDSVVFNPYATCDGNVTELSSMLNVSKELAPEYKGDFRFDIKEIIVVKPAELNEEYFKMVFGDGVKDEAEYRNAVKSMIEASLESDQNYRFTLDTQDVIGKQVGDMEIPDEILKEYLISQNDNLNGENIEEAYKEIRSQLVWDLEKDKIGQQLGVKVEVEDLQNTAKMIARQQFAQYGMANAPEDAVDRYAEQMLKDDKSRNQILRQTGDMKLFGAIRNAVTLDTKNVSVDEFNALFKA